jgi:hypothetical protein
VTVWTVLATVAATVAGYFLASFADHVLGLDRFARELAKTLRATVGLGGVAGAS